MLEFEIDSDNPDVIVAETASGSYMAQFHKNSLNHVSSYCSSTELRQIADKLDELNK